MALSNVSAKAELIGTFLECFCYGAYCIVFYQCLRVLRNKYLEGRPSTVLTSTALVIFVLVTIHVIMDLLRAIDAYTSHMDIPNSAIIYYTIVRRDIDLIKSGCYIAVTIVSDALIGYRTFVVWGRNRLVAFIPVALVFADIALGVYGVWLLSQVVPGDNALMSMVTDRIKWFYAVTLALNLLCTILISYKVWRVQAEVDRYSTTAVAVRPSGNRLILIIVESAAIYSAMLVVLIVASATNAPAMLAVLNIISPVIGIVFSMVIIRFSMDRTRWDSLKISTHLNFASGSKPDLSIDPELFDSPVTDASDPPRTPTSPGSPGKEKITVEDHVRPPSRHMGLGLGTSRYAESLSLRSLGGSLFSSSKSSLPEFYV